MRKLIRKMKPKVYRLRHQFVDKFVFIHINKTGGSSVERALKIPFGHETALEKIARMGRTQWDRRFSFTVIRNPWDKVVSHYHFRVQTNQTNLADNPIQFNEWVKVPLVTWDPDDQEFDTLTFNARMPVLTPPSGNQAIKGVIQDTMYIYNPLSDFDTIKFTAYIIDRALNESNQIETPPIVRIQ